MSKEVNLISSRRREESISYRNAGNIKKIAYFLLSICVLISIVLFSLNTASGFGTLSQKEESLNKTLTASQQKIIKMSLVKDRIDNIASLQSKSKSYENILVSVSNSLPKDASFDSFQISNNLLNITVSSSSLLSINSFLDYIINNLNNNKLFKKVTVNSLVGDVQSGRYILVISIILL